MTNLETLAQRVELLRLSRIYADKLATRVSLCSSGQYWLYQAALLAEEFIEREQLPALLNIHFRGLYGRLSGAVDELRELSRSRRDWYHQACAKNAREHLAAFDAEYARLISNLSTIA